MKLWKRTYLIALSFSLISVAAFAQPDKSMPDGEFGVDYNQTDTNGQKQGPWVRVYQGGAIYYKGSFKNDIPQGEFWFWYETGEPMSKVNHIDGTKHMVVENYHKNRKLMSSGAYREMLVEGVPEKVKDGEWEFYTKDGMLKTKENYKMGIRNGTSISYHENGKMLLEANYVDGKKNGNATEYFSDGTVKMKVGYADDEYDGPMELFKPGRRNYIKGTYVKGLKDGLWIIFNDDGTIQMTTKYDMGNELASKRVNGEFTDYYPGGIPKAYLTYEDGELNGPFSEWYDQGEWIKEPMDEPMPGGGIQFKEKLVGTQVEREGDYLDGKLEGPVTYYNEDGRIMKIEYYLEGELQSTEER